MRAVRSSQRQAQHQAVVAFGCSDSSALTVARAALPQGSLVRAVRRVEEVLRQAAAGAGIMGEAALVALFQQGSAAIKRDVVFAASLYL